MSSKVLSPKPFLIFRCKIKFPLTFENYNEFNLKSPLQMGLLSYSHWELLPSIFNLSLVFSFFHFSQLPIYAVQCAEPHTHASGLNETGANTPEAVLPDPMLLTAGAPSEDECSVPYGVLLQPVGYRLKRGQHLLN